MKLCRYDEDCDQYFPIEMPHEFIRRKIRYLKYKIINLLDKDTKHAMICKIIHRHKKPEKSIKYSPYSRDTSIRNLLEGHQLAMIKADAILDSIEVPWNCVRCGKKQQLNMMVDEPYSAWKDYVRIIDMPTLHFKNFSTNGMHPGKTKSEEKKNNV